MFKAARIPTGMSTEAAAFSLHVGRRTLINYEQGHSTVPPEVALKMAEVYGQPSLSARYCSEYCPIGQKYCNPVEDKDLAASVLTLIKEHNDVKKIRDKLIEIASDGIIDETERADLESIMVELLELERSIETMKLLAAKVVPIDDIIQKLKKEKTLTSAAAEKRALYRY